MKILMTNPKEIQCDQCQIQVIIIVISVSEFDSKYLKFQQKFHQVCNSNLAVRLSSTSSDSA